MRTPVIPQCMNTSRLLFFSFFLLFQGLFAGELPPTVPPKKWSLYKTRFNQRRSTPLESLAFAGSLENLSQFWEMLGGDEAFMKTKRIVYDVFDLAREPFAELKSGRALNFEVLKDLNGSIITFLFKPMPGSREIDLHSFDPVLEHVMEGSINTALSGVFGFSVSRQYDATVLKLWTFDEVHRPFYDAMGILMQKRKFGLAKKISISKFAHHILKSDSFAMMPYASDDEEIVVSEAKAPVSGLNPLVSFADAVKKAPVVPVTSAAIESDEESSSSPSSSSSSSSSSSQSSEPEIEHFHSTESADECSSLTTEAETVIIQEPVSIASEPAKSSHLTEQFVIDEIISMEISPEDLLNLSVLTNRIRDILKLRE